MTLNYFYLATLFAGNLTFIPAATIAGSTTDFCFLFKLFQEVQVFTLQRRRAFGSVFASQSWLVSRLVSLKNVKVKNWMPDGNYIIMTWCHLPHALPAICKTPGICPSLRWWHRPIRTRQMLWNRIQVRNWPRHCWFPNCFLSEWTARVLVTIICHWNLLSVKEVNINHQSKVATTLLKVIPFYYLVKQIVTDKPWTLI